ncbi:Carbohydrate kinase [Corynebacterium renale]|uniref:bifunctional ADP-dependent NAD(P)H-hydrate dehydratase/NAD(P)H-hydrate epimerase n=1 Tax=Corynebacterium renale TaxID=1724 RepID=UPI000DA31F45|nr:bifunctional ADP-dependent NAD(P)H-hydrate dehydratase/NAD(P)H-hydrate epimerase [Corynebacterium renale]SQG63582.1 Carbohydrate kinase [Corynebacterium renale]
MHNLVTHKAVRTAEHHALANQTEPDQLMRRAAHHIAETARTLTTGRRIHIYVGPGGNGGDGLYAGAELAADYDVTAELTAGKAHERALAAFRHAGGRLSEYAATPDLVIDAIAGLGSDPTRPHPAMPADVPVLAVDIPTGTGGPNAVHAECTVTFAGVMEAHAYNHNCGTLVVADVGLRPETTGALYTRVLNPGPNVHLNDNFEPGAADNKYTGGVVGIIAGSETYPGASLLSQLGALHTTPAMVRAVGDPAAPEVVAAPTLDRLGQCQAYVYGPGRGQRPAELADLLDTALPLLLDADAITTLAHNPGLRARLSSRDAATVLTPHDGEFARLSPLDDDRRACTEALATKLGATVVLKGRTTTVSSPGQPTTLIDAGHSWSATPGSGDVLSGCIGALLARYGDPHQAATAGVQLHALASWLSAATAYGPGPTTASNIAAHLPDAIALATHH